MFLPGTALDSFGLSLRPSEYTEAVENESAKALISQMNSPYSDWEIREGWPYLVRFDRSGYTKYLVESGIPKKQARAYAAIVGGRDFNQINRRGIDRLRTRLAACRDVAIKLWSNAESSLESVPVGVAFLAYLNAGAHPVPGGGNAILMNVGLCFLHDYFVLMLETQKKFGNALPPKGAIGDLARLANAIFGNTEDWTEFVIAFPRSLSTDDDIRLQSRIKMALACLFILLHEYGHIALGHTDELRTWPRLNLLSTGERQKYCSKLRQWEFAADRFALDVLEGKKSKAETTPLPDNSLVDMIIRDVFGIMGAAGGNKSRSLDDTHPPTQDRVFALYGVQKSDEFLQCLRERKKASAGCDEFINAMVVPILVATSAVTKE